MKIKYLLFAAVICLAAGSCKILSPKEYNSLVAQRDSLNTRVGNLDEEVARLRSDTTRLHRQINDLRNNNLALNSNLDVTSNKANQLADDLKKREARLKEVEDVLKKRDEATNALKDKLQKALLGFQANGLTVDIRNGKVYVSLTDKLLFPSGSIIIDDKGKQALKQLAEVMNKEPDINMAVEGHTDDKKVKNLGQIKDNWDLSVLRATSVTRYLTEVEMVDPHRLTATGKGESQPIDPADNDEARAKNRRIEIVLSPKLDELYNLISK
jgi:chemotaxis protein MotB